MLFPIRDSIPSRITPIVTTGIIIACGLTFVYELFVGANLPALFDMAAAPGAGGVAWFAHIGGFVFGVAIAFWVKQRGNMELPQPRARVWYGG